mgnify:CR=1 FL=1
MGRGGEKDKFAAEINKQLRKADVSYMLSVNQLKNSDNQLDEDILINTKFVEDPIIRKELLIDLMAILTHMQGNVIYRGQNENTLNDSVRDGLKLQEDIKYMIRVDMLNQKVV